MDRPALMGVAEVAQRLGVTSRRVRQLVNNRDTPLPDPVRLSCGLVWYAPDIEQWITTHRPQLAQPASAPVR